MPRKSGTTNVDESRQDPTDVLQPPDFPGQSPPKLVAVMINQRSAQAPIRTIPRKIGGLLSIHPSWAPTKLDPHTNNPHVKTSSTISGPLIYLDSHSFMGVSISIAFDRTLGERF